jgi:hypothetical protein
VAWTALSRPQDVYLASESAKSFDFKAAPLSAARPGAAPSGGGTPAAASPPPIRYEGMARAEPARPPSRKSEGTFATPLIVAQTRRNRLFSDLLRAPARFLAAHSALRSPGELRAFLADKRGVDAFLNATVVRAVLASPALAGTVLGSPSVARAFLASPAMRDPGTVRALLSSRMAVKMLDCPGVQAALADPAVTRGIVSDPETARWLAANPQALILLGEQAPALARSMGAGAR